MSLARQANGLTKRNCPQQRGPEREPAVEPVRIVSDCRAR